MKATVQLRFSLNSGHCFINPTLIVLLFFAITSVCAQQTIATPGNVIPDYGNTFDIENPDFKTDTIATFKMVFDIAKAPEDPSVVNPYINTLARFLNMHEKAGVPMENIHLRTAIHGQAAYGMLANEFYKEKFGVDNPNIELLEALNAAGVELILCGQTAGSRGISSARRLEIVDVALSAMTILSQSQQTGYSLIAF